MKSIISTTQLRVACNYFGYVIKGVEARRYAVECKKLAKQSLVDLRQEGLNGNIHHLNFTIQLYTLLQHMPTTPFAI